MYEHLIIQDYFLRKNHHRHDVAVGIGDDAAVLDVPSDKQLVVTMDTLNAGIHFPYPDTAVSMHCYDRVTAESKLGVTSAFNIGYKAAAVNLSDIAAMAAMPAWVTLSLSLPEMNTQWLEDFSDGFMGLLNQFNTTLIGGDLNRGPLSITVQAHGLVDKGKAVLRSTAQPGDLIYVSGEVGTAAYALALIKEGCTDEALLAKVLPALERPQPRIELALALREHVSSMMDISDGITADLSRILRMNNYGAIIDVSQCPVSPILQEHLDVDTQQQFAFIGGDDYELLFTIESDKAAVLDAISTKFGIALTQIGRITHMPGITLLNADENCAKLKKVGNDHFKE